MLKLHAGAEANFNKKALSLIKHVKISQKKMGPPMGFREPDFHCEKSLKKKNIIGEIKMGLVDYFGENIGFFFHHGTQELGIVGEGYLALKKLADAIAGAGDLNHYISSKTVENLICDWVKSKVVDGLESDFCDFMKKKIEPEIKDRDYWFPIKFLAIQNSFELGKVRFVPITKILVDSWCQIVERLHTNNNPIKEHLKKNFRRFQGHTAITMLVKADSRRGQEIAFEEAAKSLSAFRIFSPAAIHPKDFSLWDIGGHAMLDRFIFWQLDENNLPQTTERILSAQTDPIWYSTEHIKSLFDQWLGIFSHILKDGARSNFAEAILHSATLFSESALKKNVPEKLLYIFASLESIFLKDQNEPIQINLSERIALFVGKDLDSRKKILRNIKNVYSLRSQFVHHGKMEYETSAVQEFMLNSWKCLLKLVENIAQFQTKQEFLGVIDDQKLS